MVSLAAAVWTRVCAAVVEAVNRFLGGELNGDAMLKTVDPSLYRQRCPQAQA